MESEFNILSEFLPAIIGVFGTISGVILGFLLNRILSAGKINVFINEFRKTPCKKDGSVLDLTTSEFDTSCCLVFNYDIDLYNSSSDFRIIRNLKMILKNNDEEIKYDLQNIGTRFFCDLYSHFDTLSYVNIPPKSVKKLRLQVVVSENYNGLLNAKSHLQYFDFRGRYKIINIPKM